MSIIPHIRFLMIIPLFAIFYYILDQIVDALLPSMATGDPYFVLLKAGWSFLLIFFFFGVISHYLIEVRRRDDI